MANYKIIVDLDRCMGCDSCTTACMQENRVDPGRRYTKVLEVGPYGEYPRVERYHLPVKCQHCDDAPCVHVCPTQASYKREDGITLVDHSRCIGCQYCVMACPYGVRSYNEHAGVIEKCTLCSHRIDADKKPACVDICPGHARLFGDMDDPESEPRAAIDAAGAEALHRFADVGNHPGEAFLLARKTWRS